MSMANWKRIESTKADELNLELYDEGDRYTVMKEKRRVRSDTSLTSLDQFLLGMIYERYGVQAQVDVK